MLNTLTYSSGASISSFSLTKNSVDVAAYQILMGLWWLLSYFSSPINYIGQALLPKEVASGGGKAKLIISICMRLALIVAVLTSSVMFALPLLLPGLFTNDLLVQQAFKTTIAPVVLSLFIICITTVQDGVFIGMGKVNDYVRAGGISTLSAWIYFTFSISNRLGMKGAWNGMLIFSIVRALWYGFRWKSLGMDLDGRK
jgi:Na+-driven multidrug efflux pump